MDTFGLPMRWRRSSTASLRQLGLACAAACAIASTAACTTTMTFGSVPRVDRLQALKAGASTSREITQVLGEPRGQGGAKFQADFPEASVWFYEYMQSDGQKAQVKMLLVFVHEGLYTGHMWFSSGQLIGVTQ
jgi:outer membrane protein assembly factor BamE (lipoprotein component of BamABCDE complex)